MNSNLIFSRLTAPEINITFNAKFLLITISICLRTL